MAEFSLPVLESNLILKPLKALGQIQRKGFFRVRIPYIPLLGPGEEVEFLVRSTSIPEIKRESTIIRDRSGEKSHPNRSMLPHDWSVTAFLMEFDTMYRKMFTWYNLLDTVPLDSMKTEAFVELYALNETTIDKVFTFSGLYPKNVPGVQNLGYDEPSGLVTLTFQFGFDSFLPV